MKTVLITGINGFLGSGLAKRLSTNYKVVGTEHSKEKLHRIKRFDVNVYLSDEKSIDRLFAENQVDVIIHTATVYGRNNEKPLYVVNSNLISPIYLLESSIKNRTGLFINIDTSLSRYSSIYSLTKKQFKDWIFFRSDLIKCINVQLEHFYGPGAAKENFITSMLQKLVQNTTVIDLTNGEQHRDFIYFDDVLDFFELLLNKCEKVDEMITEYEVGTGVTISIKELLMLMKELTGSRSKLNFGAIPYRKNELMLSQCKIESISKLGFVPKHDLRTGLLLTLDSIRQQL